jgi:hypothetical protein
VLGISVFKISRNTAGEFMIQQPNNKPGVFLWSGKGLIGLLALVVLGGGALAFNYIQKTNTSSPQSGNNTTNNNQSTAKTGDVNAQINPIIQNQNDSPNGGRKTDSTPTKPSLIEGSLSPGSSSNSQSTTEPLKAVTGTVQVWNLKYPVYLIKENQCIFQGFSSVSLTQTKGGGLSFKDTNALNVYGFSKFEGTVASSGEMSGSIASDSAIYFISLESTNFIKEPNTLIKGTAKMKNCPDSTFELRLN